jgi:hypothetical protein
VTARLADSPLQMACLRNLYRSRFNTWFDWISNDPL